MHSASRSEWPPIELVAAKKRSIDYYCGTSSPPQLSPGLSLQARSSGISRRVQVDIRHRAFEKSCDMQDIMSVHGAWCLLRVEVGVTN